MQSWETEYSTILDGMKTKDIEEFQTDPDTFLAQYGTSTGNLITNMLQDESDVRASVAPRFFTDPTPDVEVVTHWWGVQILFNEAATLLAQDAVNGVSGLTSVISTLTSKIPGFGQIISLVAGVWAGAMRIAAAAISFVDKGNGVHFNWTWAQLAMLTVPGVQAISMSTMIIPFGS